MLRSILESARNIHAHDTSEKAVTARKINSIADFNGLEFTAKVGIEADRMEKRTRLLRLLLQNNLKLIGCHFEVRRREALDCCN